MKFLSAVCILFMSFNSEAQCFHFDQTYTVLVKTTDQSPAHWYFEIFNDALVDTTLRWKTTFDANLPPQWVINFDDQDAYHSPIQDGDSSDFALFGNPTFPQKLIIGAVLNNTPGNASVYFDIYDPADPSYMVTIQYRFVVSMGSGTWNVSEMPGDDEWFSQNGRHFEFKDLYLGKEILLFDSAGKQIHSETLSQTEIDISSQVGRGIYYLTMISDDTYYSTRVILN